MNNEKIKLNMHYSPVGRIVLSQYPGRNPIQDPVGFNRILRDPIGFCRILLGSRIVEIVHMIL